MFIVSLEDIGYILKDFGIFNKAYSVTTLQCCNNEEGCQEVQPVRLISKILFKDNFAVVARFKNETGVSLDLVQKQCQFEELLRLNGISCPVQYKTNGRFARWYNINGQDVIVTIEEFVNGEVQYVDKETAEKTGKLLAKTHNISEKYNCHIKNNVLFNPFTANELFSFRAFSSISAGLQGKSLGLHHKITAKYNEYMGMLSKIQDGPCYAVQGDISNCNLYHGADGTLGIFDFNRCGDNNLFCNAVMQAVFECRLMDYPDNYIGKNIGILKAFLKGYQKERPFTNIQKELFPYLYTIINTFWSADIIWAGNALLKEYNRKNYNAVHNWLEKIWKRISVPSYPWHI